MPLSPTLETERLILRQPRMSDAESHYKYFNDYEVTRYLAASLPWPYPADGSAYFLNSTLEPDQPSYYWAITKKDIGDQLLGLIELRPHLEEGHRGFWLGREFHNQGIMTEAANATTDFWFNELNKKVLMLSNAVSNNASRRIKEKTGATFIGTEPGTHVDPDLKEVEHWKLTRQAWQAYKNNV